MALLDQDDMQQRSTGLLSGRIYILLIRSEYPVRLFAISEEYFSKAIFVIHGAYTEQITAGDPRIFYGLSRCSFPSKLIAQIVK